MPLASLTTDTFWRFSGEVYLRDNVAPSALALQDNFGVNVNLLLFLVWCISEGVILNLSQFATLRQSIASTESALLQHRKKRRAAHPDNGGHRDAYERLKSEELALEKEQQAVLVEHFNRFGVGTIAKGNTTLNASVAAFINLYQLRESDQARHLIRNVISAC